MKYDYAIELLTVELNYLLKMPKDFKDTIRELEQAINLLQQHEEEK
jgi:prefoldin subunit 5